MEKLKPKTETSRNPLILSILFFTMLTIFVTPSSILAQHFGPFPDSTTIFIDVDNTTGDEDGSQEHPFNNIQEGINVATNGDVVGVAPGVYAEIFGPGPSRNYMIDGLQKFSLVGMGPDQTIIRGDHSGSLILVWNGASALIQGFTIEEGGYLPTTDGGGIDVHGGHAPTSLVVENVILRGNTAINGGAISASRDVQLDLTNVIIAGNKAQNCCGGVALNGTFATLNATFTNVTVTDNLAKHRVGGINVERATLNLINSIVWNNSLTEVGTFGEPTTLSVSFSDVGETLMPGLGNISAEPQFTNPIAGDYHLLATSPCIDAGTDVGVISDIDGDWRPWGAGYDMGADEFVPDSIEIEIDIKPGSYPNSINLKSKGKVPVAILTTDDFDAYDVDPDTVTFTGANPLRWTMEDVDNDGGYDMLFHFKTQELELTEESTEATLEGETYDEIQIEGTDSVNIVPNAMYNKISLNTTRGLNLDSSGGGSNNACFISALF